MVDTPETSSPWWVRVGAFLSRLTQIRTEEVGGSLRVQMAAVGEGEGARDLWPLLNLGLAAGWAHLVEPGAAALSR